MLTVSASRVGTVFGTHSVLIDSDTDTMELKHTAKGRLGFAEGALAAAEWIIGKEGYFTLEDMIHDITST
jgi:4-hydroxy-tetrahydrodipicolinate reductase